MLQTPHDLPTTVAVCALNTVTSWLSTRISAFFECALRASNPSQAKTCQKIRYSSRTATADDHARQPRSCDAAGHRRGRPVRHPQVTVSPGATLIDALLVMDATGLRHLPVMDGNHCVGLLTDTDIQHQLVAQDLLSPRRARQLTAEQVCRRPAPVVLVRSTDPAGLPGGCRTV